MKDKSKIGYLGLLGIPLAMLGIAGSVAFAQTTTPPTPTTTSAQVEQTTGHDTDTIQDQKNDGTPDSGLEAAEAPETSTTADSDGPGGPQDEGIDVGTQDTVPGVK
jgi:cytoskeletal protein RodZ